MTRLSMFDSVFMIIPPSALNADTLDSLLQEYITREGTDYGLTELDLQQKMALLKPQVLRGEVLILFDQASESVNLVAMRDYTP